jgi:hypothetical protein
MAGVASLSSDGSLLEAQVRRKAVQDQARTAVEQSRALRARLREHHGRENKPATPTA